MSSQSDHSSIKNLGKNTGIYVIGTFSSRATAFLLIPLYTHFLSIEDFGLLSTLLVTIQIMITIMSLGSRTALVRFIKEYEDEGRLGALLGGSILINFLGGFLTTAISVFLLQSLFRNILHLDSVGMVILLTSLAAFAQTICLHLMSYYRAVNKPFLFVGTGISVSLLLIATTLLFLKVFNFGINGVLCAQIVSYGLVTLFIFFHDVIFTHLSCDLKSFKHLLKFGAPLILMMSGDVMMSASAMYFLSYFNNLSNVAIYSLASKIANIATLALLLPFQLAYEPFVYANLHREHLDRLISKTLTLLILCFAIVSFGILFVFRDLIYLIAPKEDYTGTYLFIFLLMPGIAFQGVGVIGQSLLHIRQKTHVTGVSTAVFTGICVALNFLLIRFWGIYAVVLNMNLIFAVTAIYLLIRGIREYPIPLEKKRLAQVGLFYIILIINTYLWHPAPAYLFYTIVPLTAAAGIFILYLIRFFADDEIEMIKQMIEGFRSRV